MLQTIDSRKRGPLQAGVTLIELMIVVAIVGILAGLAVYMFSKSTKKARATEVRVMMAEFKARQGAYYVENNAFLPTAADDSQGSMYPPGPAGSNNRSAVNLTDAAAVGWQALRIKPYETALYCSYVSIGLTATTAAGGRALSEFSVGSTIATPDEDWFYTMAQCDWDDDPAVDSLYLTMSTSDGMLTNDEGR